MNSTTVAVYNGGMLTS